MCKKNQYIKLLFFYTVVGLALSLIINIAIIRLEPNPITLNNKLTIARIENNILPQGWAFFTKDVNKGYFKIYRISNLKGNKFSEIYIKGNTFEELYGIKRNSRVYSHKLNYILDNITSKLWSESNKNPYTIKLNDLSVISIKVKKPMLTGLYLIARGTPLQYEWYKSKVRYQPKMNYLILNIKNEK